MIKTKYSKNYLLLFVSFMFTNVTMESAQSLNINSASSTMTIFGTTNVHDWQSKIEKISGEMVIDNSKQIQSLEVEIPVRSIKSGEKLMDTKTYEAFNATQNPTIVFHLIEVTSLLISNNDINVTLTGNLTMDGVTKKIIIKSTGKNIGVGAYQFKGSVPLKMTDYKMKPPTAMLGFMKVGDAINIKFDITLNESNQLNLGYSVK